MGRKIDVQKKVDKFYILFNELKVLANEKQIARGNIDKKLSSVYHKIEGTETPNASESHKLIKELKSVLSERRCIKRDDSLLRSFVDQLSTNVGNAKKKTKEILNKHADVVEEIRVRAKE